MKLVLANGQSQKFRRFFANIQRDDPFFDYSGFNDLLFIFDEQAERPAVFYDVRNKRYSYEYEGVYLKGYGREQAELAFAAATVLDSNGVAFIDTELRGAPCLTKIHAHAKLAAAGVRAPRTYAGAKKAIIAALNAGAVKLKFPMVLKRADVDRGIDNYMVRSEAAVRRLLRGREKSSLWVLQDFVPNAGFYRVNIGFGEVQYVIFRTLEERPDHNRLKAHMFKPAGGANAQLVRVEDLSSAVIEAAVKSAIVVGRQHAGVDIICDAAGEPYVLEVNYDPQLVTVKSFPEVRKRAFMEMMQKLGSVRE